MLTVKEAVQAAQDWVRDLYAEKELRHLRLEEVEFVEMDRSWRITLGWVEPAVRQSSFASALNGEVHALPRVYKRLDVDAETGAVRSMRMREVA